MSHSPRDLLYRWNEQAAPSSARKAPRLLDETLRDGLQSPSAIDPPVASKKALINLMARLGVDAVDIGLPGASDRARRECQAIAKHIEESGFDLTIACAARTHPNDIDAVIEVSRATNRNVEVLTFLASSPIRLYSSDWSITDLEQRVASSVKRALRAGLTVSFVTEDTTRSKPETLERLFKAALNEGATGLVLCDTVGYATPDGVRSLVGWTRELCDKLGIEVTLDWHGHNDRGLAVVNSLTALRAGCDRIHGTALGIGERVGNAALDQLWVNLFLDDYPVGDPKALTSYVALAAATLGMSIPPNYPVFGTDAFRTATGVHAAAIVHARRKDRRRTSGVEMESTP